MIKQNKSGFSAITIFILLFFSVIVPSFSQQYSNITYDAGTNLDFGSPADVCADDIIVNGTLTGDGTICDGPNPVTMVSFNFSLSKRDVNLNWVTSIEVNNSGFELYRAIKGKNEWSKICSQPGHGTTNTPQSYSYIDSKMQSGTYNYKLKQIDYNGNFEFYTLQNDVVISKPGKADVSQNYPNPSNPKSKIDYQIPSDGKVIIKIYDIIGREIFTLVNEIKLAGYYTAEFDGTDLSSGIYFYRIIAGNYNATKKMILVK